MTACSLGLLNQLLLQRERSPGQLEAASPEVAVAREQEEQIILLGHPGQDRDRRLVDQRQLLNLGPSERRVRSLSRLDEGSQLGGKGLDGDPFDRAVGV